MMKIEPGCKAMIMYGRDTGKEVKVIKYLGEVPHSRPFSFHWKGKDRCEIDLMSVGELSGAKCNHAREKHLLRIDDFKENKFVKAEELEPVY